MKTVRIYMEGGVIQDMIVPMGVKVEVFDYDVEGVEEDRVLQDANGDEYVLSEWFENQQAV